MARPVAPVHSPDSPGSLDAVLSRDGHELLLVPEPSLGRAEVLAQVGALADARGWCQVQRIERTDQRCAEDIFETADDSAVIRCIDDHFVSVGYLAITGPGRAEVAAALRAHIPAWGRTELLALWRDGTAHERAWAVRGLAAIAPMSAAPSTLECLIDAAGAPEVLVRKDALLAIARVAWPELLATVRERSSVEPELELRHLAAQLAQVLRALYPDQAPPS